ncbi:hypothetical protein Hanom_Chr17g01585071 [Helianthus anomalus]
MWQWDGVLVANNILRRWNPKLNLQNCSNVVLGWYMPPNKELAVIRQLLSQ